MQRILRDAGRGVGQFSEQGHPLELGYHFTESILGDLWRNSIRIAAAISRTHATWLAALVCCSAFDIALHDAYGVISRT